VTVDVEAIALRGALWWLLFPGIGIPVSLIMHRRGQSGFLARFRVWMAIIPVYLGTAYLAVSRLTRWPFALLLAVSGGVAAWEVARLELGEAPRRNRRAIVAVSLLLAAAGPVIATLGGPSGGPSGGPIAWPVLAALWLVAPALALALPRGRAGAARTLLLALYIGAGQAAWAHLLALPTGYRFVLFAFSVVSVADIVAFVCGRLLPRVHILRSLSPAKTLAGFLGGGAAAVAAGFVAWFALPELSAWQLVAASLLLATAGMAGDLVASAIKRQHVAKDFGHALGRMGGVMDRIDSLLVAGWAFVIFVKLVL